MITNEFIITLPNSFNECPSWWIKFVIHVRGRHCQKIPGDSDFHIHIKEHYDIERRGESLLVFKNEEDAIAFILKW